MAFGQMVLKSPREARGALEAELELQILQCWQLQESFKEIDPATQARLWEDLFQHYLAEVPATTRRQEGCRIRTKALEVQGLKGAMLCESRQIGIEMAAQGKVFERRELRHVSTNFDWLAIV